MRNNKIKTVFLESRGRQAGYYSVWGESGSFFFTASFSHPNLENREERGRQRRRERGRKSGRKHGGQGRRGREIVQGNKKKGVGAAPERGE